MVALEIFLCKFVFSVSKKKTQIYAHINTFLFCILLTMIATSAYMSTSAQLSNKFIE